MKKKQSIKLYHDIIGIIVVSLGSHGIMNNDLSSDMNQKIHALVTKELTKRDRKIRRLEKQIEIYFNGRKNK